MCYCACLPHACLRGHLSVGCADQSSSPEPKAEAAERPEMLEAHAAPLSLDSVVEAQSALLHERQSQGQPEVSEEEKKAQRRRYNTMSKEHLMHQMVWVDSLSHCMSMAASVCLLPFHPHDLCKV